MKSLVIKIITYVISKQFLVVLRFFKLMHQNSVKNTSQDTAKISVINTFDKGGGAAKIAFDLSNSLKYIYEINFFVAFKKTNFDWIRQILPRKNNFIETIIQTEAKSKGWIEFSGFNGLNLLKESFFNQSSIVHLHNLHGEFLSPFLYSILFKNKKVIWTIHDESILTGHCGFTMKCEKWKIGCGNCPDLKIFPPVNYDNTLSVLKNKKKLITKLQPVIVCPSFWLAESIRKVYPDLQHIEVIPNGINTSVFFPRDKEETRAELGLPKSKLLVLYVAEFATNNPFKGGSILREIIADKTFSEIVFITVGGNYDSGYSNHLCYNYIHDEVELAKLYAACDVLLYPTQADNLPLVVLESMSSGTPVIASSVGGIPEIINTNKLGYLIEKYDEAAGFKQKLLEFIDMQVNEKLTLNLKVRNRVVEHFSFEQMIESYKILYNK